MVLAGATRPRHMPPKLATSPIAQTPGTCVCAAVGDDDAAARAELELLFAARLRRGTARRGACTPIATITMSASMIRPSAISTPVTWPSSSERTSEGKTPPWTVKPLASISRPRAWPAPSSSWVFIEPGGAVDDDRGGAELFGAGRGFEAQQAAADGDGVDLAAQLRGELGDRLVDGPDVLEGAVDVGEFGAGDGQAGRVRAGRDDQFVIRVDGAGGGFHGFRGGVDAGDALAGPEREGLVVPH